jgi:hypothetical protein
MSMTQETLCSANVGQKHRHQEDGRAADAGKKLKEQNRKETIRKRLQAMTADDTAVFIDQQFSAIEILRGMIGQSGADLA